MSSRSRSAPRECPFAPDGTKLCKCGCGRPVGKGRRSWHDQSCVDDWLVRYSPARARAIVFKRDRGVCRACGVDVDRLEHRLARALAITRRDPIGWHLGWEGKGAKWVGFDRLRNRIDKLRFVASARIAAMRLAGFPVDRRVSWWAVDHIVPFASGGAHCGLENLQTLCWRCHDKKTKEQIPITRGKK